MICNQFTGSTKIMETMQETLQGLRVVKAFGLEPEMRRRVAEGVALRSEKPVGVLCVAVG